MLAFRLILFLWGPLPPTKSFLIEWSHISTELGLWPGFPHYSSWWNVTSFWTRESEIRERYAVTIIQHLRHDVQPLYRIFGYHPGGLDQEMWYRTLYRMTLGLTSDGLHHPNPTPIRRLSRTPRQFLLTYPEDYFFVCLSWACQGPRFPPFGYQD